MTTGPKVSVIVPIYNVEKYLAQCLDSLVNQTLRDIEIVLIDDASPDGCARIAADYAKRDARIKLITHERNGGVAAARNTGIRNSVAPLIMFCDPDDFYHLTMCEKMYTTIMQSGADVAQCGIECIYEANEHMAKRDARYYGLRYSGLRAMNNDVRLRTDVSPVNKIWRREILDSHDIRFPEGLLYEDAYFFWVYMCWAKTIFFVPEKLYTYRRRPGSTMNRTFAGECSIDHLRIGIVLYEYLQKQGLWEARKHFWQRQLLDCFNFALRHSPTASGKRAVYDLAIAFIDREKFSAMDFPEPLHRRLIMLKDRVYDGVTRSLLGGLIKIEEYINKEKVHFCGIPIWKVKYGLTAKRYYLLGFIRLFKKSYSGVRELSSVMP